MKKITFLLFSMIVLFACNSGQKNNSAESADQQYAVEQGVGNDKDDHGCITSAGETWSELKQECVQVFNVGKRLNPVVEEGDAIISAFVLFNDDNSKVELFLPDNETGSTILEQSENDVYQNDVYKYVAEESSLYVNGEKKYAAE